MAEVQYLTPFPFIVTFMDSIRYNYTIFDRVLHYSRETILFTYMICIKLPVFLALFSIRESMGTVLVLHRNKRKEHEYT